MKTQTLHPAAVKKRRRRRNAKEEIIATCTRIQGNANKGKIADKNDSKFNNSTHTRNKKG